MVFYQLHMHQLILAQGRSPGVRGWREGENRCQHHCQGLHDSQPLQAAGMVQAFEFQLQCLAQQDTRCGLWSSCIISSETTRAQDICAWLADLARCSIQPDQQVRLAR